MERARWEAAMKIALDNVPEGEFLIDLRAMPDGGHEAIYMGEHEPTSFMYSATLYAIQPELTEP